MTSLLGVSVIAGGQPVGHLYLEAENAGGEPFSEGEEETVVLLARFAGVAIDHARRYSSLEARHTELRCAVDALHAAVEPGVQRGALRGAIECQ
jgi:GAF domain-containing protein